jgi:hypothetical protein
MALVVDVDCEEEEEGSEANTFWDRFAHHLCEREKWRCALVSRVRRKSRKKKKSQKWFILPSETITEERRCVNSEVSQSTCKRSSL